MMKNNIGTTRSGLRLGYTTGSCAAGAARAAAEMLLSGTEIRTVRVSTPKGIELFLDVEEISRAETYVECAVRKYSGDDPDVTDGILVFARVEAVDEGKVTAEIGIAFAEADGQVILEGGPGVGRVSGPGLEQKPGQAAINKVPRRMIGEALSEVCGKYGYSGRLKVTISVPGGSELAEKTFNPRLGITGGISILGTSGIVEPMSEKALTDTIWLEMKMLHDRGMDYCYVVPGNYGTDFLTEHLHADPYYAVKCSNYVGEAIDDAKLLGMKGILLIGHAGKFIKLAAGVMNTHSRQADCRMEVLASHAAMAGADPETVRLIMGCINTSEAIRLIRERNMLDTVMKTVMERISFHLSHRAGTDLQIGAVMFTLEDGILGKTDTADRLLEMLRKEQDSRENEDSSDRQIHKHTGGTDRI